MTPLGYVLNSKINLSYSFNCCSLSPYWDATWFEFLLIIFRWPLNSLSPPPKPTLLIVYKFFVFELIRVFSSFSSFGDLLPFIEFFRFSWVKDLILVFLEILLWSDSFLSILSIILSLILSTFKLEDLLLFEIFNNSTSISSSKLSISFKIISLYFKLLRSLISYFVFISS